MKSTLPRYTALELAWVQDNCQMPRAELARLFSKKFDRPSVTECQMKSLCSRKGWSAGPAAKGRNRGKSLIFTTAQVNWIKANAKLSQNVVLQEFTKVFPGTSITASQIVSYRKRNRILTGRLGRFAKGDAPWSKGRKIGSSPNSKKHQFKPGHQAKNAMPFGTERVRHDGYIEIKVDQINPYTGTQGWYVAKHKHLWEMANGPIPEGHILKSRDGDRTNCDPSNWMAIPRSLAARLSGKSGRDYDAAPAELKPIILATAKLEQAARDATRLNSN